MRFWSSLSLICFYLAWIDNILVKKKQNPGYVYVYIYWYELMCIYNGYVIIFQNMSSWIAWPPFVPPIPWIGGSKSHGNSPGVIVWWRNSYCTMDLSTVNIYKNMDFSIVSCLMKKLQLIRQFPWNIPTLIHCCSVVCIYIYIYIYICTYTTALLEFRLKKDVVIIFVINTTMYLCN